MGKELLICYVLMVLVAQVVIVPAALIMFALEAACGCEYMGTRAFGVWAGCSVGSLISSVFLVLKRD